MVRIAGHWVVVVLVLLMHQSVTVVYAQLDCAKICNLTCDFGSPSNRCRLLTKNVEGQTVVNCNAQTNTGACPRPIDNIQFILCPYVYIPTTTPGHIPSICSKPCWGSFGGPCRQEVDGIVSCMGEINGRCPGYHTYCPESTIAPSSTILPGPTPPYINCAHHATSSGEGGQTTKAGHTTSNSGEGGQTTRADTAGSETTVITRKSSSSSSKISVGAAVGISFAVILILAGVVFFVMVQKKKETVTSSGSDLENELMSDVHTYEEFSGN
eukprot:m.89498 g.89498  ORF g.89498 m.89498 type:complete len:269 (-) comp13226_c0_seq1:356-1162(-)